MSTKLLIVWALCVHLSSAQDSGGSRLARDMAAIEQLHARDTAAAKVGDIATLATLWTTDAVALPPGEQPVIGINAIRAWLAQSQTDPSKLEIVEYVMDFKEIRILGDDAFEWARTSVTVRPKGAPRGLHSAGNLMRILKRESDGSWRVARAAWNMDRPSPEEVKQNVPPK